MTLNEVKAEVERLFYEADDLRDKANSGTEAEYNLYAGKSEAYSEVLRLLDRV